MDRSTTHTSTPAGNWNMLGYAAFTVAGLYFTFFGGDPDQGPLFLMLALIFDPFQAAGKWADRTWWQRGVLLVHIAVALFSLYWAFIR